MLGLRKFSALWRGDVSLKEVYWFWFGVIIPTINIFFGVLGFYFFIQSGSPLLGLVISQIALPYSVWIVVPLWRSASNYTGNQFWAIASKITAAIYLIVLTFSVWKVFETVRF